MRSTSLRTSGWFPSRKCWSWRERARSGWTGSGRYGERGARDQAPLPEGDRIARRDGVLTLAEGLLEGDARSLARAMSLVENGAPEAEALLDRIYGKKAPAP